MLVETSHEKLLFFLASTKFIKIEKGRHGIMGRRFPDGGLLRY